MVITGIREQLVRDEGLRLDLYKYSVGKSTIGYGRNIQDVGISLSEANVMLDTDLAKATVALLLAFPWAAALDYPRRGILINMAYNIGIVGLQGFTKTLALVKAGKYTEAAKEMLLSTWATQVGPRATRLSEQMATGIWV